MGVLSNIEIGIFEATNDVWVQLHVCEGSSPKEGGFTTIFGAKIDAIGFSNFFQYFIVNHPKGSFNTYVNKILIFFDHLPTYSKQMQ